MIAGTLELQMMANIARLTDDMAKAKKLVGDTVGSIEKVLGTIGVGFSASILLDKIGSIAEGMAKLQLSSEKTGASIENLSKLQFFANASGSSIDSVTQALAKLSKNMAASGNDTAAASQALKYLGLSAKDAEGNLKDPAELMGEIAQKLLGYQDGAGKAAIAQALFGKAGAEMLPTLKKMAELGDTVATVTTAQAAAAEAYRLEVAKLDQQKQMLWNTLVSALLPSMTTFIDILLGASKETDSLGGKVKSLAADGSITAWADSAIMGIARVVDVLKLAGLGMGAMIAISVEAYHIISGNWSKVSQDGAVASAMLKDFLTGNATTFSDAIAAKIAARNADDKSATASAETQKKALNFTMGDAAKMAAELKLYTSALQKYEEQLGTINKATIAEKAIYELTEGSLKGLTLAHKAEILAVAGEADELKFLLETTAAYNKVLDELENYEQAKIDRARQLIDGMQDSNDKIAFENSLIGMSADERERLNIEYERTIKLKGIDSQLQIDGINKQFDELAALVKTRQEMNQQVSTWTELSGEAGKFFGDLVVNGKSAFDNLKTYLKSFLQQLVALFVQKWVLQIAATATGSAALGNAAASVGATGSGSTGSLGGISNLFNGTSSANSVGNIGNSISSVSNLFGNAAGSAYGAGFSLGTSGAADAIAAYQAAATTATAAGDAALAASMTEAATSLEAGADAAGGALGTAASALPYIGWAVAAISLISSMMGKGGGPKVEGDTFGTLGAGGVITPAATATGGDGQWYTAHMSDAAMASMAVPIGAAISQLVTKLGGSASGIGVDLGYNTDPQGSAPDNIAGGVSNAAGQYVYRQTYDVARGGADAALQLESQRMILAGVQAATGIDKIFTDIVSGIDLTTATAAQITTAMQQLSDTATLRDAFKTLGLNAHGLTTELITAAGGAATLATNLQGYYQNYYSASEQQAKATANLSAQFTALGDTMPTTREGFRSLVEGLDLTTSSGQDAFAKIMALQDAFAQLVPATQSATAATVAAARSAADIANERAGLQTQLDNLTLTAAQLLDKQRAALDASNVALFDQVQAATAAKAASDAAVQAATDAAAAEAQRAAMQQSWQTQLDVLNGTITQTQVDRNAQLASTTDAATLAIMRQVFAMQDQATAANAAAAAAQASAAAQVALATTNNGIQDQISVLNGSTTQQKLDREKQMAAATSEVTKALLQKLFDAQDQAASIQAINQANTVAQQAAVQAAQQAAAAQVQAQQQIAAGWQSTADSIVATMNKLQGDLLGTGPSGFAAAQAQFTIATAQAMAGDKTAAGNLPALAQSMVDLYKVIAPTAIDQALLTGRTLASLRATVQSMAQFGITVPAYATGTDFVPVTGPAMLHRGERVMTSAANDELVMEIRELRKDNAAMRGELVAISRNSKRTADIVEKSDAIGPAPARAAL